MSKSARAGSLSWPLSAPLLRAAIVLLGLQVTPGELLSVGGGALLLALAAVSLTLPFTMWLGTRLGVRPQLAQLIGAGTGICGASAVVAANDVVGGAQEDVAYALAIVTLFGTIALLLYPIIGLSIGFDERVFGLWTGSSIHEVVQAVGAASAGGAKAAEVGTITKLARVVLLAPALFGLGYWVRRTPASASARSPVPWFAFGFLLLVGLGGTGLLPTQAVQASRIVVPFLMATAVAALGLGTDLLAMRRHGLGPIALGAGSTLFICVLGLAGALIV